LPGASVKSRDHVPKKILLFFGRRDALFSGTTKEGERGGDPKVPFVLKSVADNNEKGTHDRGGGKKELNPPRRFNLTRVEGGAWFGRKGSP